MTDATTPCDDSYALSDFVRGLNGFTGAPLADIIDAAFAPKRGPCRCDYCCAEIEQDEQADRKDGRDE